MTDFRLLGTSPFGDDDVHDFLSGNTPAGGALSARSTSPLSASSKGSLSAAAAGVANALAINRISTPPLPSAAPSAAAHSSRTDDLLPAPMSSFEINSLQRWVTAFCVVNFDLELGPTMDFIYPQVDFNVTDKKTICFAAMPDSNSSNFGDSVFCFRFRVTSDVQISSAKDVTAITADPHSSTNVAEPASTAYTSKRDSINSVRNTCQIKASKFLYGWSFFRQSRDLTTKRGCFQKSLVLLSPLGYHAFFSRVIQIMGPQFLEAGRTVVESSCSCIASWPEVGPHQIYELPFLNSFISVKFPKNGLAHLPTRAFASLPVASTVVLADIEVSAYVEVFKDILEHLWLIWELALLNEPIVVFASSPTLCSLAVLYISNIISPVTYTGDIRPYLTIQDQDYRQIIEMEKIGFQLCPFNNTLYVAKVALFPIRDHEQQAS